MYLDFQVQGRYLFPALTPIAVYVLLGIRGLFPKCIHRVLALSLPRNSARPRSLSPTRWRTFYLEAFSPPLRQVGSVVVVVALFGLNIISLVGYLLPAYRVIATQ